MELHLVVPTSESRGKHTLTIDGQNWRLVGPYATDSEQVEKAIPPYACVSYVWGSGRLDNALFPSHLMSDQTLPALQAVIRAAFPEISAFWIDAFCIPYDQPARRATLESMGFIYSAADCVIATLGPEYVDALLEITEHGCLAEDFLSSFESSAWIASVWTYQEIVNANKYFVISMSSNTPVIEGDTFLDRIGYSLHMYKQLRSYSSFDIRRIWPHLDAFEHLGGDYRLYNAFQRPALQILFMLDRRVAHEERNKYYAMIGSLTAKRVGRNDAAGEALSSLRKRVVNVCEEKGDWSFLYSSTMRDEVEPWMPSSGQELRSILPFFLQGSGQSGRRDEEQRVWLEKVLVVRDVLRREDEVNIMAVKEIIEKQPLHITASARRSFKDLRQHIQSLLSSTGFTGVGNEILLPYGIFFPQSDLPTDMNSNVVVDIILCMELRWMFGRPGLLVYKTRRRTIYIPGVLIGNIGTDFEVENYVLGSMENITP